MLTLLLFSAALGWCGTPYPGWWRKKGPPPPPPPDWFLSIEPEPDPWRIPIGIIGGVAGGLLMSSISGGESLAVVGLAAFAGGRILNEVGRSMMSGKRG